jgi:hypothetical protein
MAHVAAVARISQASGFARGNETSNSRLCSCTFCGLDGLVLVRILDHKWAVANDAIC